MFKTKTKTTLATAALAVAVAVAVAIVAAAPSSGASVQAITACGQTVTANASLTKDLDCAGTSGIVVGASGITIDLKGHTLEGDRLPGHDGIYDIYDNVTIKNGVVRNFDSGVSLSNHARGVTVSNVVATGNTTFGIYVYGDAAKIASSTAAGNGGTGVDVDGGSASVMSSTAVGNGGNGIVLGGTSSSVKSSKASANAGNGIIINGGSAKVMSATADGNGATGIMVSGDLASVTSSRASGNAWIGISVSGDRAVLTGNRAEANGFAGGVSDGLGDGIYANGSPTGPAGAKNVARGNDDANGCSPSSLCPVAVSNPKGAPITTCGQFVSVNAYLAHDLDCPGVTGIVVGAPGITIDLNGHVLTGNGVPGHDGVADLGGYDNVTIKNGVVRTFDRGIYVYGDYLTVSNVVAVGNTDHGIAVDSSRAPKIVSSTAARNGYAGIAVEGDKALVATSTVVGNAHDGIALGGGANSVKSSSVVANNPSGINLGGAEASVVGSTVFGNALYGVYVDGDLAAVRSTTVAGNASHGIAVLGDAATLSGNRASGNGLPSGVSDGFGMGIFSGGFTTAPTGTNVALGNDDAAACAPSALC